MRDQIDEGGARDIAARIERLNRERGRMAPRDQMHELRAIRRLADAAALRAVGVLAAALERALLARGAEAPVHAYLDRLYDAVEVVDDDQPRFVELALATVGARLALA